MSVIQFLQCQMIKTNVLYLKQLIQINTLVFPLDRQATTLEINIAE